MRGIRHDVCITSSASFLTPVHQWLWNRDLIRRNAFYLFIFYNAPELNCYPPEVALNQVHDHRISHDSLRKRNYSLHQLGFNLLPSETSLSVQWKDANYLLHSRWWLFFFWAVIVSYTNFWMIVGNQLFSFQRHSVSVPCFIQSWTPCAFCGCVCWRKHLDQYPHALSSFTRVTVISVVVKTVNVYITNIMPSNPETLIFNVSVNTHECCFLTGIHPVLSF